MNASIVQDSESPIHLALRIASEPVNVVPATELFGHFLNAQGVADTQGMMVVLRELLLNAILHGNNEDAERRVYCCLARMDGGQFKLIVQDEGEGFDYEKVLVDDRVVSYLFHGPSGEAGRGYALIRALSDRIAFNEKGNRVTAYFYFYE